MKLKDMSEEQIAQAHILHDELSELLSEKSEGKLCRIKVGEVGITTIHEKYMKMPRARLYKHRLGDGCVELFYEVKFEGNFIELCWDLSWMLISDFLFDELVRAFGKNTGKSMYMGIRDVFNSRTEFPVEFSLREMVDTDD